jgi:hypothetical protein
VADVSEELSLMGANQWRFQATIQLQSRTNPAQSRTACLRCRKRARRRDLIDISHNLALAFEQPRIVKVLFDVEDRRLLSLGVPWIQKPVVSLRRDDGWDPQ